MVLHLKKTPQPTAIFAVHDRIALLVHGAATVIGIYIRDELSLSRQDGIDAAAHPGIPRPAVAPNDLAIGSLAAQLLVQLNKDYDSSQPPGIVDTQLFIRASTAPSTIPQKSEKHTDQRNNSSLFRMWKLFHILTYTDN